MSFEAVLDDGSQAKENNYIYEEGEGLELCKVNSRGSLLELAIQSGPEIKAVLHRHIGPSFRASGHKYEMAMQDGHNHAFNKF